MHTYVYNVDGGNWQKIHKYCTLRFVASLTVTSQGDSKNFFQCFSYLYMYGCSYK
jgi:hypothetical protein